MQHIVPGLLANGLYSQPRISNVIGWVYVSGLSNTAMRSETPPSSAETADAALYNPEMLIIAMERVTVLFDRSVCLSLIVCNSSNCTV